MTASDALREARKALGLSVTGLARAASVDTQALLRFESGEHEIPGELLWRFSDVLGVPLEDVSSVSELRRHAETLAVRFKADDLALSEGVRLAVGRAAAAARNLVELEILSGRPNRYAGLSSLFPGDPPIPSRQIWRAGRDLAARVRDKFGVSDRLPSVLRFVSDTLGISVIWQRLPIEVAGYAMCDEIHGPTIVLNVNGRNRNELVRRFTLAHEAAHVLFDRQHMEELGGFDSYEDFFIYSDDFRDPREVRANAFAIHLLAPETEVEAAWNRSEDPRKAIRGFMMRFGISYEAARYHLANYALFPIQERLDRVPTTAPDDLKVAESSELWYPAFDRIPIERRHALPPLAFELWREDRISTGRLREVLGTGLDFEELLELSDYYLDPAAA